MSTGRTRAPRRRGGKALPIPDDLEEMVKSHTSKQLATIYGVGMTTIQKWRRARGIRSMFFSGEPDLDEFQGEDSPEIRELCLNCSRVAEQCTGNCVAVQRAKVEERERQEKRKKEGDDE